DGLKCSVGKFLTDETVRAMMEKADAGQGDLVLILAGSSLDVYEQMGTLRLMMGREHDLIDESVFNFLWITDFPLIEWNADEQRYQAMHHPFTAPKPSDIDQLEDDPASVRSRGYDLVLNGYEIGG